MQHHTPDPWELVDGSLIYTRCGAANASGQLAATSDGWLIAEVKTGATITRQGDEAMLSPAEVAANKALILAAPAMARLLLEVELYGTAVTRLNKEVKQVLDSALARKGGYETQK